MMGTAERLNNYISESEPLISVYSAELTDYSYVYREPVAVGVTDRRLVSLSDVDGFTSIPYEHVSWIRSGQMRDFVYGGNDYRLLLAGGLLLAGAGFVGVTLLSSRVLTVISFLLAVSGGLVLYYGYRGRAVEITEGISAIGDSNSTTAGKRRWLLAGGSFLAVLGLSGIVVFTPSIFSAGLALSIAILTITGIRVVDYAWQNRNDLDGIEIGRTNRKVVRIGTASGETVSLVVDPAEDLDQLLSRVVYTASSGTRSDSPRMGVTRED